MDDYKYRLRREKEKLLTVVAFSANQVAYNKIHEYFEKRRTSCFFYYENFLETPIPRSIHETDLKNCYSYVPFLKRYIEMPDIRFIPDIDRLEILCSNKNITFEQLVNSYPFKPKTEEGLKKLSVREYIRMDLNNEAIFGSGLFPLWKKLDSTNPNYKKYYGYPISQDNHGIVGFLGQFDRENMKREYLTKISSSKNALSLLVEYLVSDFNFVLSHPEKIQHLCMSISSKSLFYGYLWLFFPKMEADGMQEKPRLDQNLLNQNQDELIKMITDIIVKEYLPTLAIFENSWEEKILKNNIDNFTWNTPDTVTIEKKNERIELPLVFNSVDEPHHFFEKGFKNLWSKRWEKWCQNQSNRKKTLNNSFEFHKFIVASPRSIDCIKKIMGLKLKKIGDFLPSAMVVGGAGSGKNSISRMIRLFASDDYYDAPIYTINVASLKPAAIAPALMVGMEVGLKVSEDFSIQGIFQKIIQNEKRTINNKDKTHENEPEKVEIKAVIILDELNSLDTDTQGALLRLLDNSDLSPIGSVVPSNYEINFLIIGAMNEDPEKLTKESHIKELRGKSSGINGLIGEMLYEYFRKIRRLREDIYYRFIRGGKIIIPDLDERLEDIPLMFYLFCEREIDDDNVELYIPLDVMKYLISPHLSWPGNVRQLQSLAQITMGYAKRDHDSIDNNDGILLVKVSHLECALREMDRV